MHDSALDDFDDLLSQAVAAGASDLHLAAGRVALLRVDGELRALDRPPWPMTAMEALRTHFAHGGRAVEWARNGSLDAGHTTPQGERFRLNLFRGLGREGLVARHLDNRFRTMAQLGLPERLHELSHLRDGLVLVTGATGSGKSTTLASLVHAINRDYPHHILTIEDPVEFVHEPMRAAITHRELHTDVPDFASAVRAGLREDPDVILIGELRDLETMGAAITAAETGHLVFSSLHTADTVGTVERLTGVFPGDEQDAIRYRLSLTLRAVVSQRLVRRRDGAGRVPLVEILIVTAAVSNLIATGRTKQIYSAIEGGGELGMQTFDQSLVGAVRSGVLRAEDARGMARDGQAFDRLLARPGTRPTGGPRGGQ